MCIVNFEQLLKDKYFELWEISNSKQIVEKVIYKEKEKQKVFIVHGHDNNTRNEVELFIRKLDFEPIILFQQANKGDTIIEKLFRETRDVKFAIVLYTGCDQGKAVTDPDIKINHRARQNVVFEHGLIYGTLRRNEVIALVEEGVEIPEDLNGVAFIELDKNKRWQRKLAREMKEAGLPIDMNLLIEP